MTGLMENFSAAPGRFKLLLSAATTRIEDCERIHLLLNFFKYFFLLAIGVIGKGKILVQILSAFIRTLEEAKK